MVKFGLATPPPPMKIKTTNTLAITIHDHLFQIPSLVEKRMGSLISFYTRS